jgi:hypothetical protein
VSGSQQSHPQLISFEVLCGAAVSLLGLGWGLGYESLSVPPSSLPWNTLLLGVAAFALMSTVATLAIADRYDRSVGAPRHWLSRPGASLRGLMDVGPVPPRVVSASRGGIAGGLIFNLGVGLILVVTWLPVVFFAR